MYAAGVRFVTIVKVDSSRSARQRTSDALVFATIRMDKIERRESHGNLTTTIRVLNWRRRRELHVRINLWGPKRFPIGYAVDDENGTDDLRCTNVEKRVS